MKRRFDDYLEAVNADKLQRMIRIWGVKPPKRKAECIRTITEGLNDPEQVENALASLKPFEQNALGLIKQSGGEIDRNTLAITLTALGTPIPKSRYSYHRDLSEEVAEHLIQRGIVLVDSSYDPTYISSHFHGEETIFSDDRLLAQVGPVSYDVLDINPVQSPASSMFRRPQSVILDIMGLLQTIGNMGGLPLTKTGTIRVSSVSKLVKVLGWKKEAFTIDGLHFPNPVQAFVDVLRLSGLMEERGQNLDITPSMNPVSSKHHLELVEALLHGFIITDHWAEYEALRFYRYDKKLVQGRQALIAILKMLPVDHNDFYALDDLSQMMFERIGEHFSLGHIHHKRFSFNETPDQKRKAEEEWMVALRTSWDQQERPWITAAFTTWLYYLGLIELGMKDHTPMSIRLTDLGRAVLHPEYEFSLEMVSDASKPSWVIQPNFEMIVYLDCVTPEQLTFLTQHAERLRVQEHTAHYRLTRTSVYHGLESGTTVDEVLKCLRAGTNNELPQNVYAEIREWAGLREQITLRGQTQVLEFPDEQTRQLALQKGITGVEAGERFLLLTDSLPENFKLKHQIDYMDSPIRCLTVNEQGIIKLTDQSDLLIASQLDQWAEQTEKGTWHLTAAGVSKAAKPKSRIKELFNLLDERSKRPIPSLLRVALETWAGHPHTVELAKVSILRCANSDVFQAISKSTQLKRYLKGILAPDLLLIDSDQTEAFKKQLVWMGLTVLKDLTVKK